MEQSPHRPPRRRAFGRASWASALSLVAVVSCAGCHATQCSRLHDMHGALVVDAFLEQAEIDAFVTQLNGLQTSREITQAPYATRVHEYSCFVDAPESMADRIRRTVDAALGIQPANVTRAGNQLRLPARIAFGHEAEHRDRPREDEGTHPEFFREANTYTVLVYLGGEGALVLRSGIYTTEVQVVPGRLVAIPNQRLLHAARGSMRQLLGPVAYVPGRHDVALWPTGNGYPACAYGSALPCTWDTCTFSAIRNCSSCPLKLARTGVCSNPHGANQLFLSAHGLQLLDDNVFDGMSAIVKIDISANEITQLPPNICNGLNSLQRFYIGDNSLVSLPVTGTFYGCTALLELDLSSNAFASLPTVAFHGLFALQELYMYQQTAKGGGFHSGLPAGLLSGLSGLRVLSLHECNIRTLPAGFFAEQSGLLQLHLDTNSITCLPSDIFRPLTSLTNLDLDGNPDLECGGPIYSFGALSQPTSWDGGGCASGAGGLAAARAKLVWCRPSCTNDYDPGHSHKPNYDADKNPVLMGISGLSAMPCMWDDCEFRLEMMGNPPLQTLVRSGTCSSSWITANPTTETGESLENSRPPLSLPVPPPEG